MILKTQSCQTLFPDLTFSKMEEIIVYKITETERREIAGKQMPNGAWYNVSVYDADGNNIISEEQHSYCGLGTPIPYKPIEPIIP